METVRKGKTASETEETQESIDESQVEIPEMFQPLERVEVPAELKDIPTLLITQGDLSKLLSEAPALYGYNPTAQEVAEFKEKEEAWRRKLNLLI